MRHCQLTCCVFQLKLKSRKHLAFQVNQFSPVINNFVTVDEQSARPVYGKREHARKASDGVWIERKRGKCMLNYNQSSVIMQRGTSPSIWSEIFSHFISLASRLQVRKISLAICVSNQRDFLRLNLCWDETVEQMKSYWPRSTSNLAVAHVCMICDVIAVLCLLTFNDVFFLLSFISRWQSNERVPEKQALSDALEIVGFNGK